MRYVKPSRKGRYYAQFVCSCGKLFETYYYNYTNGHTKSCGCLTASKSLTKTPAYKAWINMKTRCFNANTPYYALWGGRGITVCKRWLSFPNFLADMGIPLAGQSLDRINNAGNYEPENCRWATAKEQGNNHRGNHRLANGLTIQQAAEQHGIKPNTLLYRLRRGWSEQDALENVERRLAKKK